MTEELWCLIKEYIDARIDEKISDDHGRSDCSEAVRTMNCNEDVRSFIHGDKSDV